MSRVGKAPLNKRRAKQTMAIAKHNAAVAAKVAAAPVSVAMPMDWAPSGSMAERVVRMDTGYIDVAPAVYAGNTTGSITLLNPVPPGASQNQRVGKKILLKGLNVRGMVYNNSTATFTDNALIIVYDKRPVGTTPAITDVLKSASSFSQNNDDNASRFRILRRFDFVLSGNATTMTATSALSVDFYVDLKKAITVYKSVGTGAIGDISEGALYMITIGAAAPGTGDADFELSTRVRYYDP